MITRMRHDAKAEDVEDWLKENLSSHDYVNAFPFKYVDFYYKDDAVAFSLRFPSKEVAYLEFLKKKYYKNDV